MNRFLELFKTPGVRPIVIILLSMVVVGVVVRSIRRALRSRIDDNDVRYRASKIVGVVGYTIVIMIVLTEAAQQLTGLTLALGAASAGVAFALQEVIASFAGWLAIAIGRFYKVGDRIQLGGIRGDVIDIGVLRTTIMECGGWVDGDLYNGRIVRVANSFVFKEPVYNYSGEFPFLWDEIVIPIKYGSDYERAQKIFEDAANEIIGEYAKSAQTRWNELVRSYRIEPARTEPLVTRIANDNWVEFTLRYVVDHRARRLTKDALFKRILNEVAATQGQVEMASATFQLVDSSVLRVLLERSAPRAKAPDGGR